MKNKFSSYLAKKEPLLQTLIERLNAKYEYASVLGTDVHGKTYAANRSSTSVGDNQEMESGFVFRIYHKGVSFEYATNEISSAKIGEIETAIAELVAHLYKGKQVKMGLPAEEPLTQSYLRKNRGQVYSTEKIVGILTDLVKKTMLEKSVANANVMVTIQEISKLFISAKRHLKQHYNYSASGVYIIVREGAVTRYAYDGLDENSLAGVIKGLPRIVKATYRLAIELLKAELPKPGKYTIITDPSITGLIVHEAFGHGVEMDQFVKDRALAPEYMNKQVASPLISMHDGAAAANSVASYFFDDDGVSAQDTLIIDHGILKAGIIDRTSALQLGVKPTGNGRRQEFSHKTYTRMTNTYFEAGKSTLDEMIKSVEYGYYIAKTNNGMEDPKNWGIQCAALYGKEIKNGKFTGKMISPVVMSGFVLDLLKSITMISGDFTLSGSGHCGKGYKEWVRVSDGGPSLKAEVKIG
ncbi:MAG: TldD/PmbA family protein [Firmicutes bacterium]|nr:TldD/PmbA family protein [Bacillota bacterium]